MGLGKPVADKDFVFTLKKEKEKIFSRNSKAWVRILWLNLLPDIFYHKLGDRVLLV